ncbi:MAG: hypothetical protein ACI9OJ_003579 [Myxococcota bacterium]|jgi:hypothetical protein
MRSNFVNLCLILTFMLLLVACSDASVDQNPGPDTSADASSDAMGDASPETSQDSENADSVVPTDTADTSTLDAIMAPLGGAECMTTTQETAGSLDYTLHHIVPACVDARTNGLAAKPHLVLVPAGGATNGLWVHLPGSGGSPPNTMNILRAAVTEGYTAIGLAYINEPSVGTRCKGQPAGCDEEVRVERLWGSDVSSVADVDVPDSIAFRLRRLMEYLHAQQPVLGWDGYLTAEEVDWSKLSLSGFSQGGGMVGLLSRDRALRRAMHLSSVSDSINNMDDDPATMATCDDATPCVQGLCCDPADDTCTGPVSAGAGRCITITPALWATKGADTDGDHFGDGDVTTRKTPAVRHFVLVHRDEIAYINTQTVMELWGVTAFGGFTDADNGAPPYGGTHLLTSGLAPNGTCSTHQSTGNDFCQPKLPGGLPAMFKAWRYMMRAPTTP